MSNRHSIPPVDGVTSAWPADVGHTMIIGTTAAGKTSFAAYDVLRLTAEEFRIIRGHPSGDARDAGDEACA
ncbi:MAG: hypothetical protein VB131_07570 [Burkholderia gladioli]